MMEPFNIDNTLRAHHQLGMGLWMPDMMESIRPQQSASHRQQARSTAQDQIAQLPQLRARKAQALAAAQRLFVRLKDSMDTQTFHHVLQGVMDIHSSKKTTSAVVEELRPLVATSHPQMFEDFLDYIDPANDLRRAPVTHETMTAADSSPRQLLNVMDGITPDTPSSPRQLVNELQPDQPPSCAEPFLPTVTNSDFIAQPYATSSPLRHVTNFSRSPLKEESPGAVRVNAYEGSPGMAGFPAPPEFYSPIPPTFAQNFMDYTNQEMPLFQFPVETPMSFHGLPLPTISPSVMNARRLPPMGRFGPGINPHSPHPSSSSQMGPPNAFPTMPQYQQQFLPPRTRPRSSLSQSDYALNSQSQSFSPYVHGDFSFLPSESPGSYDERSFSSYEHNAQFTPLNAYPAQPKLATYEDTFPTQEQAFDSDAPNMPAMPASRQTPLQRKRGMSDLRSTAEQSQPRKVSKTKSRGRVSRPGMENTPGRNGTPPDDEKEKPYVHHICGRRFTTLEAVKGHHHSEEDGLGCWIRYGGKEKDKAWDLHPSCRIKVEASQEAIREATVGASQEQSPPPATKPRAARPARKTPNNTSKKGKTKAKEQTSSSSEHRMENTSDEYLPELGMTQKQLNEISGARPKRAAVRKASGPKRGAKKK